MAKVKSGINNETLPIPIDERFGVYLKKMNGEWVKYEYKVVRGKVDPDGHYKVILSGKEFLLRNGLELPKTKWKQFIYHEILNDEDIPMWDKACNIQLNSRDLTKVIKHPWVFLEEKDSETIIIKVDGKCIVDKIESKMQDYYADEFWKRWYNQYLLNGDAKVKIKLVVYDTEFEITLNKENIEKYFDAARLVTDRFNAYTVAYKARKPEHEIALMTMLDLVLINT